MSRTLSIVREVFIAAAPQTVFGFFVEPRLMARWFGHRHMLDPRAGGVFRVEVSEGAVASGTYMEVTPHRRVAFTWGWEGRDDLPPGRSLVDIELVPSKGGTLVRLRHGDLPTAVGAPFAPEEHGKRWSHYLTRLQEQCAVEANERRTS